LKAVEYTALQALRDFGSASNLSKPLECCVFRNFHLRNYGEDIR